MGGAQGHDVEDAGLLLYSNIIGGPAEHLPLLTWGREGQINDDLMVICDIQRRLQWNIVVNALMFWLNDASR